jgi:trigger factor
MKNNAKIPSECKREIELNIEADEVMKEFERIISQFSSRAKIPGFRSGKVPRNIIKQRYYNEIKESLINSLVPKALSNELKARNLSPVGTPEVNEVHFEENQPLRLKVQFEVWPDFKLPPYKKIKVKKKKISVSDQEINQSLEELRSRSAEYIPVEDRGVRDGDYVIAEVKGQVLKTKKFLPSEKVVIYAGEPENEEVINKCLPGVKPGDIRNFTIDYDKNHPDKKLAGKKIEYNLKVISIKEKILPEINDEFAKDLGEKEGLKELKEKINKEIISSKEKFGKNEMADEILSSISDQLNFELPEILLNQEHIAVLKRLLSSRPQHNLKKEELEQLKADARKKAEQNLRNHLILNKITEEESLEVSDEDIQEEFKAIAKANNVPLAKVIENVNKEGKREEIRNNLLLKKAVDILVENAIIIEEQDSK